MIKAVHLAVGEDKLKELAGFLRDTFTASVRARSVQIEMKYKRWQDNYAGKPLEEIRTTPFYGASNFVPQIIRMNTDILAARIAGILFASKPFWRTKSLFTNLLPHEAFDAFNEWLEFKSFAELDLPTVSDQLIFQTVKCGTVVLKAPWVSEEYTTMIPSDREGVSDQSHNIQVDQLKLSPIPFDDFWAWPITAQSLDEVQIKFHRIRLAKHEVELRKNTGHWDEESAKMLLTVPEDESSAKRQSEAQEAGIALTEDVDRPYTAVEAWLNYPLDESRLSRLVVTFNPKAEGMDSILRATYNYYSQLIDPFVDFRIMPRDNLFYGYSVPEILEASQEEAAQIHNARRDANMIANVPAWKKRMYGQVPNPSAQWFPGKVFELESMDDLEPLQFSGNYNSMIDEETFLMQLIERYVGVSAPMQGAGAGMMQGKRGTYNTGGTLAMLAEGNKRLDIFLKRLRMPYHRLGKIIFFSYKEFKPDAAEYGFFGDALKQIFELAAPSQLNSLFLDIGASDSGSNRELDRQNLLLMANTMAAYYRQVIEASTMLAQVDANHPLYSIILSTLEGARDLANRLLFVFEVGDRNRVLPDVSKILQGGQGRAGQALPPGMSEPENPVGREDLLALSSHLEAVSRASAQGNGGGGRVS